MHWRFFLYVIFGILGNTILQYLILWEGRSIFYYFIICKETQISVDINEIIIIILYSLLQLFWSLPGIFSSQLFQGSSGLFSPELTSPVSTVNLRKFSSNFSFLLSPNSLGFGCGLESSSWTSTVVALLQLAMVCWCQSFKIKILQ